MSAARKHPTFEQWRRFVVEPDQVEGRDALQEHLDACERCRGEVELVRGLARAGAVGGWVEPPDAILEQVLAGAAGEAPAPPAAEDAEELDWELADVRGSGLAAADEGVFLARSLPGVQLSVMVTPPRGSGRWEIEGRVWLLEGQDGPVQLLLVQDDHVLARTTPGEGGRFRLEEVAGPGWALELRLPDGRTLLVRDPLA